MTKDELHDFLIRKAEEYSHKRHGEGKKNGTLTVAEMATLEGFEPREEDGTPATYDPSWLEPYKTMVMPEKCFGLIMESTVDKHFCMLVKGTDGEEWYLHKDELKKLGILQLETNLKTRHYIGNLQFSSALTGFKSWQEMMETVEENPEYALVPLHLSEAKGQTTTGIEPATAPLKDDDGNETMQYTGKDGTSHQIGLASALTLGMMKGKVVKAVIYKETEPNETMMGQAYAFPAGHGKLMYAMPKAMEEKIRKMADVDGWLLKEKSYEKIPEGKMTAPGTYRFLYKNPYGKQKWGRIYLSLEDLIDD